MSLKFVPKGPINNIPSLVQIMVWRCPGTKPLSEPMMLSLLTHICVTRPQWVKTADEYLMKIIAVWVLKSICQLHIMTSGSILYDPIMFQYNIHLSSCTVHNMKTHDVQLVFWFDLLDYHSLFWLFCFCIIFTFAAIILILYMLGPLVNKKTTNTNTYGHIT